MTSNVDEAPLPEFCPEADRLRADADRRLKGFSLFGSVQKRQADAAELYERAAAKYRINRLWDEAGQAHILAAKYFELSSRDGWIDARKNYDEGAKCFTRCRPDAAFEAFQSAALLSLQENAFSMAAHLYKSMGELAETEEMDIDLVIDSYQRAADCFETDDARRNQLDMLLKVAFLNAKVERYGAAVTAYTELIRSTKRDVTRSNMSEAALNMILCRLAWKDSPMAEVEVAVQEYRHLIETNADLLTGILEAIRTGSLERWEQAIATADSTGQLSLFHRSLLAQAQLTKLAAGHDDELDLL